MWIEKRKDRLLACERFYDEIEGKNKKLSVTIKKDTAQERKKALSELQDKWIKMHIKTSDLRLSDIGNMYFENAVGRLKEQTIVRDKRSYQSFIDIVGDVMVDNVTAAYIETKMRKSDKANVTKNGYIKTFKIVLRWAYRKEYTTNIKVADCIENLPDISKQEKIKDKYLESDEMQMLLDRMTCEHHKLFTQFLLLSGCRIGELIGLDDADVNLFDKTITINKTWSHTLNRISTTKTLSSVRTIHINPELFEVVKSIKQWTSFRKMVTGERTQAFFVNPDGKRMNYDVYEKYLRENSERILGRKITAHVLRHTFVSVMSAKGLSLDVISRIVGHSNSKITKEIYLHITNDQKRIDAELLDQIRMFG